MKWIKFSKRKPPIGVPVLVWAADSENVCDIAKWTGEWNYLTNGFEYLGDTRYAEVTHWMPLPQRSVSFKNKRRLKNLLSFLSIN